MAGVFRRLIRGVSRVFCRLIYVMDDVLRESEGGEAQDCSSKNRGQHSFHMASVWLDGNDLESM
jgi:hypothetical protein